MHEPAERPGRAARREVRWVVTALVVIAATFAVLALGTIRIAGGGGELAAPQVGRVAPDFRLRDLEGTEVALSDYRGRLVVLNFWASWCIPCRDEAPLLGETQTRYAGSGLAVLGVVFQDDPGPAQAFMARFALDYPGLLDPGGRTAIDYGVAGIPETFLIDGEGMIRRVFLGPLQVDPFRAAIEALL
jgi:cytochrome c biogenesis protein CcmG, thiol:disulfide interchange protein DsbE